MTAYIITVSPQGRSCIIFGIPPSLFCLSHFVPHFFLRNWSRHLLAQPNTIWTWTHCNLSLVVDLFGGPHGWAVPWATLLDFIILFVRFSLLLIKAPLLCRFQIRYPTLTQQSYEKNMSWLPWTREPTPLWRGAGREEETRVHSFYDLWMLFTSRFSWFTSRCSRASTPPVLLIGEQVWSVQWHIVRHMVLCGF